ncbi:MAG: cryptochrome/photolyase family protein [Alphaproteobacteria bacterium]
MAGVLRVILWDQLCESLEIFEDCNKDSDTILLCETREDATYVKHHKKKIVFLWSAMRHFCKQLEADGYNVRYVSFDDGDNTHSLSSEIERAVASLKSERVVVTFPGEYRVLQILQNLESKLDIPLEIQEDNRFMCAPAEFKKWAKGRKALRMEFFYREMRKKHGILMQGGDPEGGKWNYDAENRKPPKQGLSIPDTYVAKPDAITEEVMAIVGRAFPDHFGDLEPFHFAVTRAQALTALEQFIERRLEKFGDYQDAMLQGQPWMYHSHLSFYINAGLLTAQECIRAAELAHQSGDAPLNAVEGFIRQILGWREYVRGIYWLKMPEYEQENFLAAKGRLPEFFWSAETKMNCMKQCIKETKENAYAHHIQRLMVIGNFCLLAGIDPAEVNEWYLIVYADAYQWVEMPNVTGMILYADGGYLASKPYAASGAYINKMSNYCEGCSYKVSKKNGPEACPFNYLYWNFLIENHQDLKDNHRMRLIYSSLEKMSSEKVESIRQDSKKILQELGVCND